MSKALDPKDTCVLVTGGAGFIGSHTVVQLLEGGYQVVIVDDLSNSSAVAVDRVKTIVGDEAAKNLTFYEANVLDRDAMNKIFDTHQIDRVIHFAGFKAVGESVSKPVVQLLEGGYQVVVVDDLSNSSAVAIDRVKTIVGDEAAKNLTFYEANVLDRDAMNKIFDTHQIDRVIHFAGFKAVGESVSKPVEYYHNNIENTLVLIDVMRNHGCKSIIFSSSSTVYGDPDNPPVTEEDPKKPATNPYGWTKWMIEQILMDVHTADPEWDVVLLRYFNPIGAHPSGLIGEDPKGIPNNLVPYVAQVAVGKLEAVQVFGNDYPTPDGTGVRDYIHVCDLASGHVAALNWMNGKTGVEIFNLGTGTGTSVLEVVAAFSKACGKELPYVIRERRAGDIAANWCDASKAERMMGWKAQYDIADMCRDSWNWQSHNPNGFADAE